MKLLGAMEREAGNACVKAKKVKLMKLLKQLKDGKCSI